jgi:hypothetical protein
MMVGREDLELSKGGGGVGIVHISKVVSSVEVMVLVCGQESLHTDLTENQTWYP